VSSLKDALLSAAAMADSLASERDGLQSDVRRLNGEVDALCDTVHDLREKFEAAKLETIEALAKTRPAVTFRVDRYIGGWSAVVKDTSGCVRDITPRLDSEEQARAFLKPLLDALEAAGVRWTVANH